MDEINNWWDAENHAFVWTLHQLCEVEEVEGEDPYGDDWEEYEDPWEREYIRSVTGGDYSSANPWDAPGMSVSDFI